MPVVLAHGKNVGIYGSMRKKKGPTKLPAPMNFK